MVVRAQKGKFSREARAMMLNLEYMLGQGLGRDSQGMLEPILAMHRWKGEDIGSYEIHISHPTRGCCKEITGKRKVLEIEEVPLDEDEDLAKAIKLG